MLQAKSICRRSNGHHLLNDVSLVVSPGDRAAIVGTSGSGKTLLLRALALLDPLDSGHVQWQGNRIGGSTVPLFRSQVIYLSQRPVLLEASVAENLQHPFKLNVHRKKTFDRDRAVSLLAVMGRDKSFLDKHQRDLSGGESQIAALLRAVLLSPVFLLLDEPTAALDRQAASEIESMVTNWLDQSAERAVVWITHDRQQARRVARSWWQMDGGSIESTNLDGGD